MLQQLPRQRPFRERELAHSACRANELGHPLDVEVAQCRLDAWGRVEGSPADQIPALQILHQRRVESGHQLRHRAEALPDQPSLSLADQRLHLGMPGNARSLYEDQPMRSHCRRVVELPLRRGYAFVVLASVVGAEQPYVDVAALNFIEIKLIRPSGGRRDFLEQEYFEEASNQHIGPDVVAQCLPLVRELALHAADKNAKGNHAEPRRPLMVGAPGGAS